MASTGLAQSYGGFAIGRMQLALPMSALREVLPAGRLSELPCPARCVVGGLALRGVVVPVVDLRHWLDKPAPDGADVVILMVHEGRMLGLLADRVTGVFQADDQGLRAMQVAGHDNDEIGGVASAILAGNVRRSDDGTVVSVLDAAALSRLDQVPLVDDPEPQRQQQAGERTPAGADGAIDGDTASDTGTDQALTADADPRLPMMLMRCGRVALAVHALVVHATLSDPQIERSVLGRGACLGVIDYDGLQVPAVDLLSLTGLGRYDPESARQTFLMQLPQGLVALMISEVMDVARTLPDDVIPVPRFALPQPDLMAGALPVSALGDEVEPRARTLAPQYLVIDAQALRKWPALVALASTNTPRSAAARAATPGSSVTANTHGGQRLMIVFDLNGETATPIEQVIEILPFSTQMTTFSGTGTLLGMVALRGRMIPVMCLSGLLGLPPPDVTPAVSVLVTESDGELIGFAVPRLTTIEAAHWEPSLPTPAQHRHDALGQVLHARKLAQVGQGAEQRMLRVLDLRSVARTLQQRALSA